MDHQTGAHFQVKKVTITLYYLKDAGSIRMTASLFGVATCTVSKTIYEVCHAFSTNLGPKYIKLPETVKEMKELIVHESRHVFLQAFGCIDGTTYKENVEKIEYDDYKEKYEREMNEIKTGFKRVKEKIKSIRQHYSEAVQVAGSEKWKWKSCPRILR